MQTATNTHNSLQRILNAFRKAGYPAALEYDHKDGFFDVRITLDDGDTDVLHVREENDGVGSQEIVWYDFTHTTSLGPIDGSEIAQRLG